MANYLVDPFCRGIYAGKANMLSIKSCFPQLYDMEQQFGSVIFGGIVTSVQSLFQPKTGPTSSLSKRAKQEGWSIYTLQNGLQSLPDALHRKLSDQVTISTGTLCTKLQFTDNGKVKVRSCVILPHIEDYVHEVTVLLEYFNVVSIYNRP